MPLDTTTALVIGAGIQGAGITQALAAAGHEVLLVERSAIAAGTSSRSSKLIHGGLRYLENLQFSLVAESLTERRTLLKIAPHLVRLVPFYIPIYSQTTRSRLQIRAGLSLYALLGGLGEDSRYRSIPRPDWESLDGLQTEGLKGVYCYQDGQTDDAALCRAVTASAAELGARVALGAEVLGGERRSDRWLVRLRLNDEVLEVDTRLVINAAGPWANSVLNGFAPAPRRREVELVGGTHIEVEGAMERGIYYAEAPTDRRAVFVMPWRGHTLVGTTETPFSGDPSKVSPESEEVDYLLGVLDHYFPDHSREVLDAWAGLRVLPKGDGRAFRRSREVILSPDDERRPSFVTVYGGKLTGYRATAARVLTLLQGNLPEAQAKADTSTLLLPPDPHLDLVPETGV
ncbi:MAG TPA: glycerol-3-phosphate dehydrogenase/oxidase [Planctomycetes bacterium]|nr:glycerol-3-phosphate dehydrogenase/oxidase [Planctomycetota bacterium]HIK59288.1 glycerol-3-phosphate dehydrogenase/oxidase [Planctomycetota bacterium]